MNEPRGFLDRLSERQTVLALLLFGLALYVPFAGSYGLWDPWETHYGEVARQMVKRGDFISLYWPGSPLDPDVFWSKPVLTFWIMTLAMKVAGLGHAAAPASQMALGSTAEWAMRLPFCLLALSGLYGVYLITSRFVSRRAGLLAAVALATMPMYSLIARQAMTDMPFVGPMTLALALAALALFEDNDRELPRKSWSRGPKLTVSWPHHPAFYLAIGLFALVALPQIVIGIVQLRWHIPRTTLVLPGIVPMLPYVIGAGAFFVYAARTRTLPPLYLSIAAVLAGLAVLAKGLAGLGLPVIILLAYLLFTWNWGRLRRPEMLRGLMVALVACAVVAVPWHHMMLVRHGKPFWNELYGDNHWKRLVVGRHGDNNGMFDYFLRELGYAVLPWITVAPAALVWGGLRRLRRSDVTGQARDRRQEIFWFGAIWFVAAYAVVSVSMTKFHHYILPSLPGLAIAIGCFLDDLLDKGRARTAAAISLIGVPLLALVTFDLTSAQKNAQHFVWLFSYDYINAPGGRPWPPALNYAPALTVFAIAFGCVTLALVARRLQRFAVPAMAGLAVVFTYFLLDVYMRQVSQVWSQKDLIATYYKERRSPDERLVAWQMYWRGETFYTSNEIYEGPQDKRTVFLGDRNAENLKDFLGRSRGQRVFFVVEKARWGTLQGLMPDYARHSLHIINDSNNKFCLALAQL